MEWNLRNQSLSLKTEFFSILRRYVLQIVRTNVRSCIRLSGKQRKLDDNQAIFK